MTSTAGYAGLEVRFMAPGHAGKNPVDALPGYWLTGARYFGELHDRGLVRGDHVVARHASTGLGKSHERTGVCIRMTGFAGQPEREVGFVAIGERLLR